MKPIDKCDPWNSVIISFFFSVVIIVGMTRIIDREVDKLDARIKALETQLAHKP